MPDWILGRRVAPSGRRRQPLGDITYAGLLMARSSRLLHRTVVLLAKEGRDRRRPVDTGAAVQEYRLRKAAEGFEHPLHLRVGRSLIVGAGNTRDFQVERLIVPKEPVRVKVKSATDVVAIELRKFKERYHGAKTGLSNVVDPRYDGRPCCRWQRATPAEVGMIAKWALCTRKAAGDHPNPQLRLISFTELTANTLEFALDGSRVHR